jgi:hypothetical protein
MDCLHARTHARTHACMRAVSSALHDARYPLERLPQRSCLRSLPRTHTQTHTLAHANTCAHACTLQRMHARPRMHVAHARNARARPQRSPASGAPPRTACAPAGRRCTFELTARTGWQWPWRHAALGNRKPERLPGRCSAVIAQGCGITRRKAWLEDCRAAADASLVVAALPAASPPRPAAPAHSHVGGHATAIYNGHATAMQRL